MNNKRRNSWAYGIIGLFVITVLLSSYVVFSHEKNEKNENAVNKDYNAALEKRKQERKIANTLTLPALPVVSATKDQVVIFMAPSINSVDKGTITFCHPHKADTQIEIPLEPRRSGTQGVPLSVIPAGTWDIKLDWKSNGKEYFFKETVTVD